MQDAFKGCENCRIILREASIKQPNTDPKHAQQVKVLESKPV